MNPLEPGRPAPHNFPHAFPRPDLKDSWALADGRDRFDVPWGCGLGESSAGSRESRRLRASGRAPGPRSSLVPLVAPCRNSQPWHRKRGSGGQMVGCTCVHLLENNGLMAIQGFKPEGGRQLEEGGRNSFPFSHLFAPFSSSRRRLCAS